MNALEEILQAHGITVSAVFVPFSRSRNKAEKEPSLNWRVTVKRGERDILTTDYMAGSAHCPAYKTEWATPWNKKQAIAAECEKGTRHFRSRDKSFNASRISSRKEPIMPKAEDVIYCLVSDAHVLDYSSFSQWAKDCGYDDDSISAKVVYDACLSTALALRAGFGEAVMRELSEACQDY